MSEEVIDTTKKKRGAKKGVLRGPRPVYFVGGCVSANGELVMRSIQADDEESSLAEAGAAWEVKYGSRPLNIMGPYYEKKNVATASKKKDVSNVSLDSVIFSGSKKYGEYNGWEVIVQLLTKPAEYGWLIFKSEVGEDGDDKKKQPPASKSVKLELIQNLRDAP